MKKLMAFTLALMLVFSLAACGSKKTSDSDNSNNSPSESADIKDDSLSDNDNSNNSTPTPQVSAMAGSKIFVDLEEVQTLIPTQSVDGIIMVPVQAVMEKIGYDVTWNPAEQRLEVWEPSRQHPTVILNIGNTTAYYEKFAEELNERVSYEATLDSAPILIDDTMVAPLDFITEAIGYTFDNNVDSSDIYIFSPYYMENQIGEGIGENQPVKEEQQSGEGIGETQPVAEKKQSNESKGQSQPVAEKNQSGEGVGQSLPVTEDEKDYVLSISTASWLELNQDQKYEVIFIMARWWDIVDGYVVEDFESVLADLDHQMETYFRNGVDEGVLQTACDIYGLDISRYE